MPSCSMGNCRNYSLVTKGQGVKYHKFPNDPKRQKLWVQKCRRKDKINTDTASVCSDHFYPDDYVRDLKAELLGCTPRKVLKPDAVPETKPTADLSVPLTTTRRPGSKILLRNLRKPPVKCKVGDSDSTKSNSYLNPVEKTNSSETPLKMVTEKPLIVKLNNNENCNRPLEKLSMSKSEAVFNTNANDFSSTDSDCKPVMTLPSSSLKKSESIEPLCSADSFVVSSEFVTFVPFQAVKHNLFVERESKTGTNRTEVPLTSLHPNSKKVDTNLDSPGHVISVNGVTPLKKEIAKKVDSNLDYPLHVIRVNGVTPLTKEVAKKIDSNLDSPVQVIRVNGVTPLNKEKVRKTSPPYCKVFEDRTLEQLMDHYKRRKFHKGVQTVSKEFDSLSLVDQVKWLEHRVQTLNTTIRNQDSKIRSLHSMVRAAKKDAKHFTSTEVNNQVHQILGKLFTADQINCLITGTRCSTWDEDTLTKSMALREVSRKAYVYMRNKMGYPFPGETTLKRWNKYHKLKEQKTAPSEFFYTNADDSTEINSESTDSEPVVLAST